MIILNTDQLPELPQEFTCSICGAPIILEEIDEWVQNDDGTWQVGDTGAKINCSTEPDFDESDEMDNFMASHWSMPYVDWLPLSVRVAQ